MRGDLLTSWPLRTHDNTKAQIESQSKRKILRADDNWIHPVYNFAWDLAASRRPIIAFVISPAALIDETIPAIAPISNGISFSLSTQRA